MRRANQRRHDAGLRQDLKKERKKHRDINDSVGEEHCQSAGSDISLFGFFSDSNNSRNFGTKAKSQIML